MKTMQLTIKNIEGSYWESRETGEDDLGEKVRFKSPDVLKIMIICMTLAKD